MTGVRRAEADEIVAAQLVERAQEMMLIGEPALVLAMTAARSPSGPIRNVLPHSSRVRYRRRPPARLPDAC
ncbi:hypothetical protein HYPDE_40633 [Hyphomicrobium denitrificans 1NES1]|uniref:Uncharacterized protein n=1 Tax=Hyphomicrobium denitrificans 1NES1 TaxID=670307 RepID=N0BI14_9HYPH|nr:hypothetical protein HYPDE_40633 [Hyphomicrobium denitrificans 1NES1]